MRLAMKSALGTKITHEFRKQFLALFQQLSPSQLPEILLELSRVNYGLLEPHDLERLYSKLGESERKRIELEIARRAAVVSCWQKAY